MAQSDAYERGLGVGIDFVQSNGYMIGRGNGLGFEEIVEEAAALSMPRGGSFRQQDDFIRGVRAGLRREKARRGMRNPAHSGVSHTTAWKEGMVWGRQFVEEADPAIRDMVETHGLSDLVLDNLSDAHPFMEEGSRTWANAFAAGAKQGAENAYRKRFKMPWSKPLHNPVAPCPLCGNPVRVAGDARTVTCRRCGSRLGVK